MRDPRDEQYARLLVETCIDVQPGWQVMVNAHVRGRPLFEEVCKVIAERGAHVVPRVSFAGFGAPHPWIRNASDELLSVVPPVEVYELPTARWTVPSIFSSKPTVFVNLWMPGLQPIPSSPSTRAPSSRSRVSISTSSFDVADASTMRPPR